MLPTQEVTLFYIQLQYYKSWLYVRFSVSDKPCRGDLSGSLQNPTILQYDFARGLANGTIQLGIRSRLWNLWKLPVNVLLFANGELNRGVMLDRLLASVDSPRIVCADGGALHARALGLCPHMIIGDLDSLSAEQVASFKADGAEIFRHPPEKDETDLELTLHHCRQTGAKSIQILGALGGRFDQTMANVLLLTLPDFRDMRIEIIDGDQVVRLLRPGSHQIDGASGDTISLIPLTNAADGIRTRGLQYSLADETLRLGPARGISNVMLTDEATVKFASGLLLLVHTVGRA